MGGCIQEIINLTRDIPKEIKRNGDFFLLLIIII